MLTTIETDLLIAAEIDGKYNIRKEVYYTETTTDEPKHEHNKETNVYTCGYCTKPIKRHDSFKNHLKICVGRIVHQKLNEHTVRFKSYEVKRDGHRMELMMPYNHERGMRMYISGPPRCGKSHLIGQILREYTQHHPKRSIYLFSQVESDRAIDTVIDEIAETRKWNKDLFVRIDLDKLIDTDIDIEEFRGKTNKRTGKRNGSICIFDDIDKIPNKELQRKIDVLKDAILATGRDHEYRGGDIDLIVSNHSSLGYKRTQELLNQATYLVLFPKGTSDHHIRTVCVKYCGLSPEQVRKIIDTESRYVIIHREMPLFVLEEKKVWLIK
jgi:hypothetical protein